MQLGKTLIGAVLGAALGTGLMVAFFLVFNRDQVWLSIPVGVLTGLGVRTLVSTTNHASYLRGAITAGLALAAYLGGWFILTKVQRQEFDRPTRAVAVVTEPSAQEVDTSAETPPPQADRPHRQATLSPKTPDVPAVLPFAPLDFVWLCVAALAAYELGRGTSAKSAATTQPAPPDSPQGTQPHA